MDCKTNGRLRANYRRETPRFSNALHDHIREETPVILKARVNREENSLGVFRLPMKLD